MSAPDKRGSRSVAFQPPEKLLTDFFVDEQGFAALQPILDALGVAGGQVSVGT